MGRPKKQKHENGAAEPEGTAAAATSAGDESGVGSSTSNEEEKHAPGDAAAQEDEGHAPFIPREATVEVARKTMTGDLRDAALQWIRDLRKPYVQLSRFDQQLVIDSVEKQAETLVERCVGILVTDQRRAIRATLESVTVKDDGLRAVITCGRDEQTLVELGMATGSKIMVASVDSSAFSGARRKAEPDPEQPYIPGIAPTQEEVDAAAEQQTDAAGDQAGAEDVAGASA